MPTIAGPRLRKITLNLYDDDCDTLARHYGRGWSTEVRDIINAHAELIRKSTPKKRATLGDLNAKGE
jgi:hypothetical protein